MRPLVAELIRKFSVSAAETGDADLHRRVEVSVSVVAGEHRQVVEVLASCERLVAGRPEMELLSARTRVLDSDDLD